MKLTLVKENIKVYLKDRKEPISFHGFYRGHKRPDGKETKKWHFYEDSEGKWYHFRKEEIQLVISKEIQQ